MPFNISFHSLKKKKKKNRNIKFDFNIVAFTHFCKPRVFSTTALQVLF